MRSIALFLVVLVVSCSPFATGSSSSSSSSSGDAAPADGDDGGSSSSSGGERDGGEENESGDGGLIGVVDPSCSRKLIVGNNAVTGAPDNISPGSVDSYGFSITGLNVPVAHCLWVYIIDGAGTDVVVGVYGDKSSFESVPSQRKARGVIKKAQVGWNAAALDVDVNVIPLQTQWLAIGPESGNIKLAVNPSCTTNQQRSLQAQTNVTPGELPNPFEPNFTQALCGAAMYLSPKK